MYKEEREEEEIEEEEYPKRFLSDAQVREAGKKLRELEGEGKKEEKREVTSPEAVKFPTLRKKGKRKEKRTRRSERILRRGKGGDIFHLFPHRGKEKMGFLRILKGNEKEKEKNIIGFSEFKMPSFFIEERKKAKDKNTVALLDDIFGRKKAKKGKRGKR